MIQENQKNRISETISRREKRTVMLLLLLILLVTITVGFATLSVTLNINGTSTIKNSTWNVSIDDGTDVIKCPNGEVCTINPSNPNSITPDDGTPVCTNPSNPSTCTDPVGAVIWMDGNTVYFKHVLTKPGVSFTFSTDFKNKGSIDAKLTNVTMNDLNATAKQFMTYTVTYADGTTPRSGDVLNAGQTATFKVTVTYKNSVTTLPTEAELALINETSQGHTGATSLFTVSYEQK